METEWHPTDGIQRLISQIADGIEYVHFTRQAIPDAKAIDIRIRVIMHCGLFVHDCELWIQEHDKSWLTFKIFWRNHARLKKKTVRAGQLGYGMKAGEIASEESDHHFEQSVDQFGQAHSATQSAIGSLISNNTNLTNNVATSVSALQQQMHNIKDSIQNLCDGRRKLRSCCSPATVSTSPPESSTPVAILPSPAIPEAAATTIPTTELFWRTRKRPWLQTRWQTKWRTSWRSWWMWRLQSLPTANPWPTFQSWPVTSAILGTAEHEQALRARRLLSYA